MTAARAALLLGAGALAGIVGSAGSAAGAGLLLATPAAAFDRVVPFLLAFAALALLLQPLATRWLARRPAGGGRRLLLPGGLLASAAATGAPGRA